MHTIEFILRRQKELLIQLESKEFDQFKKQKILNEIQSNEKIRKSLIKKSKENGRI